MYIFEEKNIKTEIEEIIKNPLFNINDLGSKLISFMKKFKNKDIFFLVYENTDSFKNVCATINPTIIFDSDGYVDENEPIDRLIEITEEIIISPAIPESEKREFFFEFATLFADFSDNDFVDAQKIYITIRNLYSDNEPFVKEYDSLSEAIDDIDDIYTGCCDDVFIAETMWFPILSQLQQCEWDDIINFCCIIDFDAFDIEEIRECWEKEHCSSD